MITRVPVEDFQFKHEKYLSDKPCLGINELMELFKREIGGKNHECIYALYCDGGHFPMKATLIGVGDASQVAFSPQRIIQGAMLYGAQYVYTVHNHPTQDCRPSKQDHEFTKQLTAMCRLCNIQYAGSIIVTKNAYYSLNNDISNRRTKAEYQALF